MSVESTSIPERHAFPEWTRRLVPLLAEMDANPLYWFLAGKAYGKRRWWLLGRRQPRMDGSSSRSYVVVIVILGILFVIPVLRIFGSGALLLVLLLTLVGLGTAMSSAGPISQFLRREAEAGHLDQLLMTPLTSRDWAVGWVGARLLRSPRQVAGLLLLALLCWPVVATVSILNHAPAASPEERFALVFYPTLYADSFIVLAALYIVLRTLHDLRAEMRMLSGASDETSGIVVRFLSLATGVASFALAWLVPIPAGLLGRAIGRSLTIVLSGSGSTLFSKVPAAVGLALGFVLVSGLIQGILIRYFWKSLCKRFVPAIVETHRTPRGSRYL